MRAVACLIIPLVLGPGLIGCRCGAPTPETRAEALARMATQGPPDDMRCVEGRGVYDCFLPVPGGVFDMGAQAADPSAPNHDPAAQPDEAPVHRVAVSDFWMLRNEVSANLYGRCVGEGACSEDEVLVGGGFGTYGDPSRRGLPVTGATWRAGQDLCRWLGGRLPTEAEWEYAARGTDGRTYPWGEGPRCLAFSVADPTAGAREKEAAWCEVTEPHGSGELRGEGPFGHLGLAGNLWEWVGDRYAADAYASHAATDPTGPTAGEERVQRGGGYTSEEPAELRSAARASLPPDERFHDVGFRCVWTAREATDG